MINFPRRGYVCLAALAVVFGLSTAAQATTISVTSTNGTWSNAVPNSGVSPDPVINNGGTPRTVRWGGDTGQGQSGYNYTPNSPGSVTVDGAAFLLGTFAHVNFPVFPPSLTSIDLDFSLDWATFLPDISGKFSFTHEETTNSAPCAYTSTTPCADRVTVTSPFVNTTIASGSTTYFFTLLGFSQDGGATTSNQFITQEGLVNPAGLYGKVTSIPLSNVPEPASLVLLGTGLLGAVRAARKRRT